VLARALDGEFAHAESSKSPSKAEDPATEPESGEQSQAVVQAMAAMMRGLTYSQKNMLFALFRQHTTPEILTEAENPQTKRWQPHSGKAADVKKKQEGEVKAPRLQTLWLGHASSDPST
jgi:hypothetical protein